MAAPLKHAPFGFKFGRRMIWGVLSLFTKFSRDLIWGSMQNGRHAELHYNMGLMRLMSGWTRENG